jgi:sugar lactone lactonase YvrE
MKNRGGNQRVTLNDLCQIIVPALLLVLLATSTVAAPKGELSLSLMDTLQITEGDLRGFTWIGEDTTIVLVAEPDTLRPGFDLTNILYWYDADGEVIREHDVTGVLSRGLEYDGKWLWSFADATEDQEALLYKIEADTLFVDATYPTPGHRPNDLAWDGTHLWMVDRDSGRLDRFDPETEDVTRTRPTPAFSPTGVAFDERFFWIADLATGRLYRLSRGGSVWNGNVSLETYFHRGEDVTLAWNGGALWIIPQDGGIIIRSQIE